MAKVLVGSARIDERGKAVGGLAGDQTGKEVAIENYYTHSLGWVCLRAKDKKIAEKLAAAMKAACSNGNIGYDQGQRNTLYNLASKVGFDPGKVKSKCETDCSALVRVCLAYAGVKVADFNTSTEVKTIIATKKFDKITNVKEADLQTGDILVTKRKGHTVIVTQGATAAKETKKPAATVSTGSGSKLNKTVKKEGEINTGLLNVRTWAGKENALCSFGPLKKGTKVGICDTIKANDGTPWYYIQYQGKYGFVSGGKGSDNEPFVKV